MDKIYLNKEFEKFWNKIVNNENFALIRNGDGERAIMSGKSVVAQEKWKSPNYISKLGKDIYSSLMVDEKNFYCAISCPCCDEDAYYWYSSRIKTKNITFANLWVNTNFVRFKQLFSELNRDAILIANYRAKNHKIGNLNILKHYEIDDDCISFWENKASKMIEEIKKDFGNKNDLLYVVSAGPMSGPIIVELYKNNPNNCYIDFGSSIDIYYRGNITRPYMIKDNVYAKRNCWMFDPLSTNFDVSVVLNLYRRPQNLKIQIDAIERQSLKPKEILLYQDGTKEKIEIPNEIKGKFNLIEVSEENKGVWARFDFANRLCKSKYVCVFDDDTIPGSRWLENCHFNMMQKKGLYGTIGIIMKEPEKYPLDWSGFFRVGWDGNLCDCTEVDFVGHSWFFEKEWLVHLLQTPEKLRQKYCGEDISFSYQLQKVGIPTYVPPHNPANVEFFGSLPKYANSLGKNDEAVSFNKQNLQKINEIIKYFLEEKWNVLIYRNPEYVKKIFNKVKFSRILGMFSVNYVIDFAKRAKSKLKRMLK